MAPLMETLANGVTSKRRGSRFTVFDSARGASVAPLFAGKIPTGRQKSYS